MVIADESLSLVLHCTKYLEEVPSSNPKLSQGESTAASPSLTPRASPPARDQRMNSIEMGGAVEINRS